MNWLVGLNGDGWPTAIPLDRISLISVDPDDFRALVEFRDDTARAEVLDKAMVCSESEMTWLLRALAVEAKKDADE